MSVVGSGVSEPLSLDHHAQPRDQQEVLSSVLAGHLGRNIKVTAILCGEPVLVPSIPPLYLPTQECLPPLRPYVKKKYSIPNCRALITSKHNELTIGPIM